MAKINGNLKVDGTIYEAGSVYSVSSAPDTAYYDNTGTGDQSTAGLSGTDIDITGLTGKSFPGTPAIGSTYLVTSTVGYLHDNNKQPGYVKTWVGTNGSTADTTPVMSSQHQCRSVGRISISSSFLVTLASATDKVGISLQLTAGAGDAAGISGGTAVAKAFCFMEILKLS